MFASSQLAPGSVLKVWSNRFVCFHFGVVDTPEPFSGAVRVIHSSKGSYVRTTSLLEFSEGQQIEVVWSPTNGAQQSAVLQRMHSLDGQPYDLFKLNCEHVVNWAVTGNAASPQLAAALLACIAIAALAFISRAQV